MPPYGKQIEHGVKLYLAHNGDTFGGRKVELIVKDDSPGTSGDVSKRLAQELVVKDKVDILAGFGLTPAALAVAPISAEAKKPMVIMNAATSIITTKSPYIVRTSHTLPQDTAPIATWAAKNKIKKVYTLVADFGPGHDAEGQFKKTFTAAGGEIVGEVRVPVKNPDFAPYLQKIKDTKPDAVFLFMPPGAETIAFMKGFADRGLAQAGIRIIATGDLTDEDILDAVGDPALGVYTSFHYSDAHKSPENKAFTEAYAQGVSEGPAELHVGRRLRRHAPDRRGAEEDRRQHRCREVHRGGQGHELGQPARQDHDRPRDARHRADRLHPQGREGRRQARERRVRPDRRRQGSGQAISACGGRARAAAAGFRNCEREARMTVLFDGVASGMLLFLISVGLSVTLGLMNFVNLAHGAFAMLGGYVCVLLLNRLGVPFLVTLPIVVLVCAGVGVLLERTLYRRLYGASHLDQVLFSIGLVFMSISTAHYFFGAQQQPLQLPDFLRGQLNLPGLDIGVYRLFLIVVGLAIAGGPAVDADANPLRRRVARRRSTTGAPRAVSASTSTGSSASPSRSARRSPGWAARWASRRSASIPSSR